jgi:CBS domain-containing protein
MLVAEAMTDHPVHLGPSATAKRAADEMRKNDIGDVLVVDRSGNLCGIVTDRDIALRVAGGNKRPTAKLKDICTPDPLSIGATEGLESAVQMMRDNNVRRLPVMDGKGKTVGVVSLGDAAIRLDENSVLASISKAPPNN